MYSNTSSYQPGIYRINGFKINYFPEKWTWICQHQHNSCETKKFQIKSSVQFIQVPVVWHFQVSFAYTLRAKAAKNSIKEMKLTQPPKSVLLELSAWKNE